MFFHFSRGLRMEQEKKSILAQPIQALAVGGALTLPLPGAENAAFRLVKEGDHVLRYTALSAPQTAAAVRSPISGKVSEIKKMDHPLLGEVICAVIEPDPFGKSERISPKSGLTDDEIIEIAQAAGIIDEYDGIPLSKKLRRIRRAKADCLVAMAVDEETYVCSSEAAFRESPEAVAGGLAFAARACGAGMQKIAVAKIKELLSLTWLKAPENRSLLLEAGRAYPVWDGLKRRLSSEGRLPEKIGAQACAALDLAIRKAEPQVRTVVTVAGEGVERPANLRVCIGTPIRELMEECGCPQNALYIVGSPMTGKTTEDFSAPVTADTRCLIALSRHPEHKPFACIGCGRCSQVCPEGIMPWYLHQYFQQNEYADPAQLYRADKCLGCNSCSSVCPSGIDLSAVVKKAAEIRERGGW